MNDNWWGWINLMGERFIGGLVADEVGGGGGEGGDCLASTAAKGLSVLLLFLAVGIIPSTQSACRRTLWFLDYWTGQRSKEQWTLHFCALSLLQLCIKHVKQIPVNEILQFQSETSWSWKCFFIIDCVQLFLENTLRKQSFWIWKDEWKWKLCFDIWKGNKCFGGDFKLHVLV